VEIISSEACQHPVEVWWITWKGFDKVLPSVLLTLCLDPDDFHCARPKVLTSPEKSRDFSCVKVSTRTINKRGVFATLERGFGRLIGKPYGTETVKVSH